MGPISRGSLMERFLSWSVLDALLRHAVTRTILRGIA
jgi:hypothetical protein